MEYQEFVKRVTNQFDSLLKYKDMILRRNAVHLKHDANEYVHVKKDVDASLKELFIKVSEGESEAQALIKVFNEKLDELTSKFSLLQDNKLKEHNFKESYSATLTIEEIKEVKDLFNKFIKEL